MKDQDLPNVACMVQGHRNPIRALEHLLRQNGAHLSPTFRVEAEAWAAVCDELAAGEPGPSLSGNPSKAVSQLLEASGRDIALVHLVDGLHIFGRDKP